MGLISQIEIPDDIDDCWIWTGCTQNGYGVYQNQRVHRIVWREFVDPKLLPYPEITLDHLCENRACVNPDHLEPKSIGDNVRAGSKNSAKKTHCPQGHEYTKDNTYITPQGARQCRVCVRERNRLQRLRRR